jgi:hypothetical protein
VLKEKKEVIPAARWLLSLLRCLLSDSRLSDGNENRDVWDDYLRMRRSDVACSVNSPQGDESCDLGYLGCICRSVQGVVDRRVRNPSG